MNNRSEIPSPDHTNLDEAEQLAALENFANKIIGEAVTLPKEIIRALNEKFWDLV